MRGVMKIAIAATDLVGVACAEGVAIVVVVFLDRDCVTAPALLRILCASEDIAEP